MQDLIHDGRQLLPEATTSSAGRMVPPVISLHLHRRTVPLFSRPLFVLALGISFLIFIFRTVLTRMPGAVTHDWGDCTLPTSEVVQHAGDGPDRSQGLQPRIPGPHGTVHFLRPWSKGARDLVQSDGECAGRHCPVSLTFRVWSLMVSLRKHGRGMK